MEEIRPPTASAILDKQWKAARSKYGLLSLGVGQDGECLVSQEERENHFHVIGTTSEGKSKLLEMMICRDIDRIRSKEKGPGLCLIDPSEDGDTMYKVLGYCEKVGFKKVLIIDPDSRFKYKKITPLNPIHTNPSLITKSVSYLTDAIRVIFSVKDPADTSYIENYLPSIFRVLSTAKLTLNDLKYFTDLTQSGYREAIFGMSKDWASIRKLNLPYTNIPLFTKELGSTSRRLDTVFRDEGLRLILTHRLGMDFAKLMADRWVVLVNVAEMDILPARLLSSIVINEIVFGLKRLRSNNWNGYFYLYIDEAGRYATSQIADILSYKRKLGLRLILAHQYLGQFKNEELREAIENNAKTKIAFYIASRKERDKVVQMLYGGQLEDREVSYVLSQQQKQYAVVKLGKDAPRVIKIHDTPTSKVSKEFIQGIYDNPWYYTYDEIKKDSHERFNGQDTVRLDRTAKPKHTTSGKTDGRKKGHAPESPKETSGKKSGSSKASTRRKVAWDNLQLEADKRKDSGSE